MKFLAIIVFIIFVVSCRESSQKVEDSIDENVIEQQVLPKNIKIEKSDSSMELPSIINSTSNAKFKVVEIIDSVYVKVILLDIVNREDYEEVEYAVLKTREKFQLYNGIGVTGKLFFKFYTNQEHYDNDALPAIASTFYNNLNGKTGMDIYWGRSAEITKIISTPDRKVIQI